ncbi:Amino acid permease 3 [Heracleum sosnowskyi]|uniref:Amino acid permease 3 n=1 Tax=Heracleum sosnowskyi TaxID=360622 RepID=A0AAD8HB25_9APIA|nr:Amino acid permease 3 [Heracleum sosnowskyi]
MKHRAIKRSNCFHDSHAKNPCHISSTPFMLAFGAMGILFSQIPDFNQISWLSVIVVVMSFTYSSIGLTLGIFKVAETGQFRGSLTGISIGGVGETEKIWRSFQALGEIAFAYSYSLILFEIQDTVKSPLSEARTIHGTVNFRPSESETMKKAILLSVSVTTLFYMLMGCFGHAAFGDLAAKNLLTGFGFYNPFWLLDIANIAIVVHLVGAYQVTCQPLFAFVEKHAARIFPRSNFINKEYNFNALHAGSKAYKLNLFRLVWRTIFVVITTVIPMLMPFFDNVSGILGALGFWPLTVYFPVEMYVVQQKIRKWSSKWISLQILSVACLILSIAAAAGSFAGLVTNLKAYRPFQPNY